MKKLLVIIIILSLYGGCVSVPTQTFDKPLNADSTIIVIPNLNEHTSDACRWFYDAMRKVYRVKSNDYHYGFPILREYTELATSIYSDTAGKTFIGIGKTFLSDSLHISVKNLPPCSFVIKKKGRFIVIQGSDDAGDYAGIAYFLSHYCGVKYYMPGTLFTYYKPDSTISLPSEINVIDSPFTKNITSAGGWSGTGNVSDPHNTLYWDSYWALLNSLNYTNWGSFQHTMSALFYDSSIMKKYPSVYHGYFPTSNSDGDFEPDFSSPDLVNAGIDIATKYFNNNPNVNTLAFSVMDGGGFIQSGQVAIDENAKWINSLAAKFPDKTIAYLVYSNLNGVPKMALNSNVLPITVWHLSNYDEAGYQGELDTFKTKRIGNDDWAEGKGFIYPRVYTGLLSKYLKSIKKQGISFDYAHIETYSNWALDGFKYYEMGQLYRNPDLDIDSLRVQECNDLFGAASKQMKAYFDGLEQISCRLNNIIAKPTHMYNYPQQLNLDSIGMMQVKQCRAYLDAAANLAQTPDEKARIAFFNTGFSFIENMWYMYNLKEDKSAICDSILNKQILGTDRILFSGTDSNYVLGLNNLILQIKPR